MGSQEKLEASNPEDKGENNTSLGFARQTQEANSEGGLKSSFF